MQDIKYIKRIAQEIDLPRHIVGNTIYFTLGENIAKTYCEEMGVRIEIINPRSGKIDYAFLPFSQYFAPVKTTEGASEFSQRIGNDGKW